MTRAAKVVRNYGEKGDPLARKIFEQQAIALGRLFTIAANFTDPGAYFVGGGIVETAAGVPRLVPADRPRAHEAARGAGARGAFRARPRPRQGRRPRRRRRRAGVDRSR